MDPSTELFISFQQKRTPFNNDRRTTWREFQTANGDDPDMLADVERQIIANNCAEIGGGASPLVWIFA